MQTEQWKAKTNNWVQQQDCSGLHSAHCSVGKSFGSLFMYCLSPAKRNMRSICQSLAGCVCVFLRPYLSVFVVAKNSWWVRFYLLNGFNVFYLKSLTSFFMPNPNQMQQQYAKSPTDWTPRLLNPSSKMLWLLQYHLTWRCLQIVPFHEPPE